MIVIQVGRTRAFPLTGQRYQRVSGLHVDPTPHAFKILTPLLGRAADDPSTSRRGLKAERTGSDECSGSSNKAAKEWSLQRLR